MKTGDSYIEARVHICVSVKIANIHIILIPLSDPLTDSFTFDVVSHLFHSLDGDQWNEKLISIATICTANMNGLYQGAATRFDRVCPPGFYRIWCIAHQVALLVQEVMTS